MGSSLLLMGVGSEGSWPTGKDGALLIDGTQVDLPAGSVKDYSSISIINGGVLNFLAGGAWNIIGCKGAFTFTDGSIITGFDGHHHGGTFTATAPDGTALSYTIPASGSAGNGGVGGDGSFSGLGLLGSGGGGGGGGDSDGNPGTLTGGGKGGDSDSGTTLGGSGGAVYDDTGSDGEFNPAVLAAAGGGGGAQGNNGQGLYFKLAGTVTVDASSYIYVSGDGGGGGGNGADGINYGGGGGGGGNGGSGGKIIIKTKGTTYPKPGQVTANRGSGGDGGLGGLGGLINGEDGSGGSEGTDGTVSLSTF